MQSEMSREVLRRVRNYIDEGLVSGEFQADQRLPAEREFALRLGTSRAAIRHALSVLEIEKRVVRQVGRGTFVAEAAAEDGAIGRSVVSGISEHVSPAELMEARHVLEPVIAESVVLNANEADLRTLCSLIEEQESVDSASQFEASDIAFHRALADATHNRLLVSVAHLILAARQTSEWRKLKAAVAKRRSRRMAEAIREHRRIVKALSERSTADANKAMRQHLERVRQNLLET